MVDVALVREERSLAVSDSCEEHTEDVHHRNEDERKSVDKVSAVVGGVKDRLVDGGELDCEECKQISHGEGACVTHEGLVDARLAEGIV